MARKASLYVSALNIALSDGQRHKPQQYVDLFKALFKLQLPVNIQGDRYLTVGSMYEENEDIITGVLDRYTEIEAEAWYNRAQRRRATREEMGRIIVPDDMAANLQDFFYLFDARKHRLIFLSSQGNKRLTAGQAQKFIMELTSQKKILRGFGSVAVSVEQAPESLERILKADQLRYLSITINRPNSFGVADRDFERRLERLRASRERSELWADDSGGLSVDSPTKKAAQAALSNGHVEAKLYEDGVINPVSTEDMPIRERQEFDAKKVSPVAAFRKAAATLLQRITKR